MGFETRSIKMLQNIDTFNFTEFMRLPWKQEWNILDRAVKSGRSRKKGHPFISRCNEGRCKDDEGPH